MHTAENVCSRKFSRTCNYEFLKNFERLGQFLARNFDMNSLKISKDDNTIFRLKLDSEFHEKIPKSANTIFGGIFQHEFLKRFHRVTILSLKLLCKFDTNFQKVTTE